MTREPRKLLHVYCDERAFILLAVLNWVLLVHVPVVAEFTLKRNLHQTISVSGASVPILTLVLLQ